MVPVLGYSRTERTDRTHRLDREPSPTSSGSSDSNGNSARRRIAGRLRRDSEPNPPAASPASSVGQEAPSIRDYCLGKPQRVGHSRNGAVEVYICLQEKAVFLPSVKRRHRRRRSRHRRPENTEHVEEPYAGPPPTFEAELDNDDDEDNDVGPDIDNDNDDNDAAQHPAGGQGDSGPESQAESQTDSNQEPAQSEPGAAPGNAPTDGATHNASRARSRSNTQNGQVDGQAEGQAGARSSQGRSQTREQSRSQSRERRSQSGTATHTGGEEAGTSGACSTLRGSVLLNLTKPTRIKEIGVSFYCMSRTLWNLLPQPTLLVDNALPNSAQVEDVAYLGIHRWDFVPLEQFGPAQANYDRLNSGQSSTLIGQDLYGADVAILKDQPDQVLQRKYSRVHNSPHSRMRGRDSTQVPVFCPLNEQPRKIKQNNTQTDGVLFPAGQYVYNFTLLVDANTPATVSVPNGEVKFVLGAKVVRTGAFTMNVNGHLDVDVVRAPEDSPDTSGGPANDAIYLSRVWENQFVYSVNLERRNITLDVPTKLSITLMPLSDPDVRVHQIQVYITETVTYVYSLDQAIRYIDPSLKLLLYQKDAPKANSSLLGLTDMTTIDTNITLVSEHNKAPKHAAREPYARGRYGELRFVEPDVRGPYVRVRHRLLVVMRVSRSSESASSPDHRSFYEVKIDTPVTVLSRHCVSANISLPSYHAGYLSAQSSDESELPNEEQPPSFDDAMSHELLGPPGAPMSNPRGTKAFFAPINTT